MKYSSRVTVIGLMGFLVLVLVATSWAQRPPILNRSPRPMVSIRSGKSRLSATPGTGKFPEYSNLLTSGSGSRRPAKSASKVRIKTASRSRLPTCAPSSAANPTP